MFDWILIRKSPPQTIEGCSENSTRTHPGSLVKELPLKKDTKIQYRKYQKHVLFQLPCQIPALLNAMKPHECKEVIKGHHLLSGSVVILFATGCLTLIRTTNHQRTHRNQIHGVRELLLGKLVLHNVN